MSSDREKDFAGTASLDRRQVLTLGAGLALTAAGCSTGALSELAGAPRTAASPSKNPAAFAGIDHVIVLMMENRSFDHYFGMLKNDALYPHTNKVNGLQGNEANRNKDGGRIPSFHLDRLTQADPPHTWEACREQWNHGKNDGFVAAHAGPDENDVMGYFDRTQLPFTYWLADHFTLCDSWFSSVLGPTWPNRAVLHATTAAGLKANLPILFPPKTLWESMKDAGKTAKNYYSGIAPFFAGAFLGKVLSGVDPTVSFEDFFTDAEQGTLPNFAVIDPDFAINDDHPSHSVHLGQALIASVYRALAASPQWSRSLLVVTYDEHGGFYDHVAPPLCRDSDAEFQQLGFRVPSLVIGPTVRTGAVCSTSFEHTSIASTLQSRFSIDSLTQRMSNTSDLSDCIDPAAINHPRRPPPSPPVIDLASNFDFASVKFTEGQPELAAMVADGTIPREHTDPRNPEQRLRSWLARAEAVGAVRLK